MLNIDSGITIIHKPYNAPCRCISAGKEVHLQSLEIPLRKLYYNNGYITLRQYKNTMLDVFEYGSKIDDTINSRVRFEIIKRKDVDKNK